MTSRLRELRQRLADTAFWEERRRLPDQIEGYEMATEDLAPVIEAAQKWQENGHMKGCYHAEYPEQGSPHCQSGCQKLRDALAEWGGE